MAQIRAIDHRTKTRSPRTDVRDPQLRKNLFFIKHSSQSAGIYHDKLTNQRLQSFLVKLPKQSLKDSLEIYQWRCATEMPIVKTCIVDVVRQASSYVELSVINEYCPIKLSQLTSLPFNQTVYLLKESVIGFQRLTGRFGRFQPLPTMVYVNARGKCKVWYNGNSQSNKLRSNECSEAQFLINLINIFQDRTFQTARSKIFFRSISQKCSSFIQLLKFIQSFVKLHKMKVPAKFTSNCIQSARETIGARDLLQCLRRASITSKLKFSMNSCISTPKNMASIEADGKKTPKKRSFWFRERPRNNDEKELGRLNRRAPLIKSILGPTNMKESSHTTNAHTLADLTRVSHQFSCCQLNEEQKRFPTSSLQRFQTPRHGLKLSSEIVIPARENFYQRKSSINSFVQHRYGPGRKQLGKTLPPKIKINSPSIPKTIEVEQFQEPQKQIHEVAIEQEERDQNLRGSDYNIIMKTPMSAKGSKISLELSNDKLAESKEEDDNKDQQMANILSKNGWKLNFDGLLNCESPMKKSVQIGKEVNKLNANHRFEHLKTSGLHVFQSFIPNDQQSGHHQ